MAEGPYIGRQAAQSITGGAYGEVLPIPPQAPDETATLVRQLIALYPDPDLVRLGQRLDYEKR
jgi:hypothetical protein